MKNIKLRCFFKRNGIKRIQDIFWLLEELGFAVRGCFYEDDSVCGVIVVDEYRETLPHFDKNKVITYSHNLSIKDKKLYLAYQLVEYIQEKEENRYVRFANKVKKWETSGATMLLAKEIVDSIGKKI